MCAHQDTGDIGKGGVWAETWKSNRGRVNQNMGIQHSATAPRVEKLTGGVLRHRVPEISISIPAITSAYIRDVVIVAVR